MLAKYAYAWLPTVICALLLSPVCASDKCDRVDGDIVVETKLPCEADIVDLLLFPRPHGGLRLIAHKYVGSDHERHYFVDWRSWNRVYTIRVGQVEPRFLAMILEKHRTAWSLQDEWLIDVPLPQSGPEPRRYVEWLAEVKGRKGFREYDEDGLGPPAPAVWSK